MTRKNAFGSHYYVDANGQKIPGVTTILGNGLPKKALINWAGTSTADYAVNNWAELDELPVADRLDRIKKGRYEKRDKAAARGTAVHDIAERLVHGETVDVPEELRGHVEAYVKFLDDFDVTPVIVESTVVSYQYGYAGTLDLIADLVMDDGLTFRWLLDIKTTQSGVYGETALQLAAYRHADAYVYSNGIESSEKPLPYVHRTGVVHVRSDGYDLVPVTAGHDQLRAFRYVQQVAEFDAASRSLIGEPIQPPSHDRDVARVIYVPRAN
ncbi:hypothetical protein ACWDNI_35725 [Nocardia niigatensis]